MNCATTSDLAAEHLLRLPPCDDPLAATAVSTARLARSRLEHDWLPALDRVLGSTAMLGFSGTHVDSVPVASNGHGLRPQSILHPTEGGSDDSGRRRRTASTRS